MTGMLASVNSLDEALIILDAKVDIIDLKQPALGALGALDTELIKQIVETIDQACPISATVGDLPMEPRTVSTAVANMAKTGVDYIKIGFFPGGDWLDTLQALSALARNHALIAVLFADTTPDIKLLMPALKETGFKGVMLDTMDKNKGSLTRIMATAEIQQFVQQAKAQHLLTGLAGSLRREDISVLLPYQADYLGFRGALCRQHKRTAKLDLPAITLIKQTLESGHA
jgi:(5-formylfuran-3-yl)methyl phosphate synthase